MRYFTFPVSLILLCAFLPKQTVWGQALNFRLGYQSASQANYLEWWAEPNFFYFVLEKQDLADESWFYFPFAALGRAAVERVAFKGESDRQFFRLMYTNDPNSPMLQIDFDGDQVGTADELREGTDPFVQTNSDADAIPDDWELFHGLDTSPDVDSSADDHEPDGLTDASEYAANTDPHYRDHPDLMLNLF